MIGFLLKKIFARPCKQEFKGKKSEKKERKFLHPRLRANCLSKLFFCWTLPSLAKGFAKGFEESDLHEPLPQHESSNLGDKLAQEWSLEKSKEEPSLWKPLLKIFGKEFLIMGIFIFINEFVVKLSQSVFIWKLITTYVAKDKEEETYFYASAIILSSVVNVIIYNWYIFVLRNLAMRVRIACSSLIYRKTLKLDKNSVNKTATGQIVNLLANDLHRLDNVFLQLHYLWAAPLQCLVVLVLLYFMLDLSAMAGIAVFFVFVPIQVLMGRSYSKLRLKTALKTDERVRLTNEIVSGIQVIKMYTWEELFIKLTATLRKQEIRHIRGTSYLKAVQNALNKFLGKAAVFACILIYVLTGNHLHSQYVFVIKSFYNLLKQSMTKNFSEAVKNIAEASISVQRIQDFLLSDEIRTGEDPKITEEKGVKLMEASAKWASSNCYTLSRIDFEASSERLVTVVGAVGSGKTSLIKAILQELPLQEGALFIKGKISYTCQESWLFAGTVKENILFGQPLNTAKYNEVVKVCALNPDFKLLPFGDGSVLGDRGITLSGGQKARISLARAVYKDADIYILDDPLSAVDTSVGKQLFEQCILGFLKKKCVILATHQTQYLKKSDKIYLLKNGKVVSEGDYEHVQNFSKDFVTLLQQEAELDDSLEDVDESKSEESRFHEDKSCGQIFWKVYKEYLLSGGWCFFILVLVFLLLSQIIESGADYFESYWVNLEEGMSKPLIFNISFSLHDCVYIYSGLISFIFLFSMLSAVLFYSYFMKTSVKLHDRTFSSIVKTKISFFYTNPAGSILNRFSKDLGAADSNVPKSLIDTIQNGLNVLSIFSLVAIVDPEMLISSTILLLLFYCIRKFYLATSRELKRIEAISRSPIYSHLNESIQGLETIRAFESQGRQQQTFDRLLNKNTSAFYMLLAIFTTFNLWLSLLCSVYLILVTGSCFWGRKMYGSGLGLVITQAMSLTELLSWGMIQWSEFENEMTSVERIIQYKNMKAEDGGGSVETWPRGSSIIFKGVTLRYKKDIPPALNNLTFEIFPKEKIGIVGRTGAGKTSIISALFRLVDFEGAVLIGGVNIKDLPLSVVRSHISIIPQDPVLFSGTVRENLDPFNQFTDSDLWSILDHLDLKNFVSQLPAGLESGILEKGFNLSVGQRQLLCLARALLKRNNILVFDEATANVDYETDSFIQSTIKRKLVDCTVLIIAHRLQTVMDCDKVLVMDSGRVLEFDHPHKLLENADGALYGLIAKTGRSMMMHLQQIAEENYAQREHEKS